MGSALPVMSGREVVRVFEEFAWEVVRQSLIRNAGLTVDEFVAVK
jgi:hypothetical protein